MSGVETRWWWVRHAPVVDHGGRIYGQLDMPCDTSDQEALRALAEMLPAGAVWVTSHLARTRETAVALLALGLDTPPLLVEPDFAEQNFGAWQGKSWDEIAVFDPDVHARFWQDPTVNAPPGGESFSDLIHRVRAAVDRLCAAHAGRDIVAVTHGGTIRAALALALDLRPAQAMAVKIDNLSLTRLDHIPDGVLRGRGGCWRVYGVNVPPR